MIKPKAREDNIVVQKLEGETLVYDLNENKAFCLNETSAIVWELCDGARTTSEISDEMSKRLKTSINEDYIYFAIDQLDKDHLLSGFAPGDRFADLSRREVIRKVGIASMIALPLVSSIVAPEAIAAQSAPASCSTPIGVCILPGTNLCPPGCAGRVLNVTSWVSFGGTCDLGMVTTQSVPCAPNGDPSTSTVDLRVNFIT